MRSIHPSPEIPGDGLQPMLRLARRSLAFWRLGLLALALGVAATLAFAKLRPRHYRSEAVLYYREGMQWNPNEGSNTRRQIQRLKEALLARSQLVKVVEDLGLFPRLMSAGRTADAVNEMLLATTFRIGEGDIFQLSYTSDSPQEAERVVARLTALLIDENASFRSSQAESSRAFLEAEKSRNEADLHAKEGALFQFLGRHPEFLQEPGASTGTARGRTRSADDGSALAALRREEERLRSQIVTSGNVAADPGLAVSEAAAKLKAAQRDLAAARSRYTEEHPDVRSALALVRESEDAYNRATAGTAAAAPTVSAAELRAQLDRVQREIAAVDRRSAAGGSAGAPAASSDAARHVVALETEWARLNREVGEARERLQQLDTRQFTASMTLGTLMSGQSGKIVVIDPAFVPTTPIGMSNTKAVLLGLVLTLLVAVGLVTLAALLDDRIRDRLDVQQLGLGPVLAEIGDLARKAGKPGPKTSPARERATATPPPRKEAGVPAASTDAGPGEHGPLSLVAGPWASDAVAASGEATKGVTALALKLAQQEELAVRGTEAMREPEPGRRTVLLNVHRVPLKPENHPRPIMLEEPDSAAAAGFRVLRHRLAERDGTRAILVASPSGRDGKTTCALNLWIAMGEARRSRALLVEANLRDPSIARSIGFDPPVCIGKQMEYHLALGVHSWDVAETFTPWLHAAAVSPSSEKRELLESSALSTLVEDMQEVGYDFIVVDSPAILGGADATLAEDAVDGVLMVVRCGKTRVRDLRQAVEQIGRDKLLGFVLVGR